MKLTYSALLAKCWGVCSWLEKKYYHSSAVSLLPLTSPLISTRSGRDTLGQRLTSKRNVERSAAAEEDQSSFIHPDLPALPLHQAPESLGNQGAEQRGALLLPMNKEARGRGRRASS